MDSIYLLIPIALVFTGIAIKAFFWAVDNKQFDDLESASKSILFDEDEKVTEDKNLNCENLNNKNKPEDFSD